MFSPKFTGPTRQVLQSFWIMLSGSALLLGQASGSEQIQFNRDVRPILSDNCFLCHGPDKGTREANLRLDLENGITAPLDSGKQAVIPGKPEESELVKRITATNPDLMMPPPSSHKSLSGEQVQVLQDWIRQGAPWEDHWAFEPIMRPQAPATTDDNWSRNAIDRFILNRIQAAGLSPSGQADRVTLIRRVSLDTRGLPPTEDEVQTFLNDKSPDAYETMVERFLASTHFGEHRARYWLDAARYSDTHGFHLDNYRSIWPYRDWVVDAFNQNMPFDQFTIEQIAGDMLPEPSQAQLIATGFNRCNPTTSEGGAIDEEYEAIYAKDRVEATSTVWLGMTMGCASCHDHKFDPISMKEFYQMSAFFRNTTQKAMDGNVWDTPPSIKIYSSDEKAAMEELQVAAGNIEKRLGDPVRLAKAIPSVATQVARDVIDVEAITEAAGLAITPQTNVTIENVANLSLDNPFTISFWLRFPEDAAKRDLTLFGKYDPQRENLGWRMRIMKDRSIDFSLADDSEEHLKISARSRNPIKPGEWSHIVLTYDGFNWYDSIQTYQRALDFHVNGKAIGTKGINFRAKLKGSISNDQPFVIGNAAAKEKSLDKEGADNAVVMRNLRIYNAMLGSLEKQLLALEIDSGLVELASNDDSDDTETDGNIDELTNLIPRLIEHRNLQRTLAELEASAPITLVMEEREDSQPEARILERGQYDLPGEKVGAAVPEVFPPLPQGMQANRLALAKWLVSPDNPLPARVTVNRFWQELFGTGIVKTAEDFGSQGEPPSHPQLLDWLAAEFIESGWDMKHMYRLMLNSATYRQSSKVNPDHYQKDPENRLLARGPRFRLDGEILRDQALYVSGLMVDKQGGPPVKPYQPQGVWHAVAYTGSNTARFEPHSGDKLYRRSLYTFWKRTAPPPSMSIFDAPSRESCTVRRERTNTPLQALVLMNDPQFVEAARNLAQTILLDSRPDKLAVLLSKTMGYLDHPGHVQILERSHQQFLDAYTEDPASASELIHVGESSPDASLDPVALAAMTMVASQAMNQDAFLNKN